MNYVEYLKSLNKSKKICDYLENHETVEEMLEIVENLKVGGEHGWFAIKDIEFEVEGDTFYAEDIEVWKIAEDQYRLRTRFRTMRQYSDYDLEFTSQCDLNKDELEKVIKNNAWNSLHWDDGEVKEI